jgi:NhaA family Na+:H+ antiporter
MTSSLPRPKPTSAFRQFLTSEAGGGVVLMLAAAAALIAANSPASALYFNVLQTYVGGLTVLHWINDALMAVFFLLVGLEIKREFQEGQLATWPRRMLPGFAALGGLTVPALIYLAFNGISGPTARGWAIPTATDIAFALGALALLGSRVPISLKIFLTALAILDDLAAVSIIAVFYTDNLAPLWLAAAAGALAVLFGMNKAGVLRLTPYLLVGVLLWAFTLKSGVHATLAGVALALTIPLPQADHSAHDHRPLIRLEHGLHPWVAYLIVPVFGFANAGVSFLGMSWSVLLEPVTIGVTIGLFVGKQIGVMAAAWIAIRLKLATMPDHASWPQLYGVALLCGIGFTMSLFIGILAFPLSAELQDEVKVGVLAGSLVSGALGMIVLALTTRKAPVAP